MSLSYDAQKLLFALVANKASKKKDGTPIPQPFPDRVVGGLPQESYERHREWVNKDLLVSTIAVMRDVLDKLTNSEIPTTTVSFSTGELDDLVDVATKLGIDILLETYNNISTQCDHKTPPNYHDY